MEIDENRCGCLRTNSHEKVNVENESDSCRSIRDTWWFSEICIIFNFCNNMTKAFICVDFNAVFRVIIRGHVKKLSDCSKMVGFSARVDKFLTLFCRKGVNFVNSVRFGCCSSVGIFYFKQMEKVGPVPRRL